MALSTGVRQFHRWVSMIFTTTVAANFVAMAMGPPPAWVTYSPLPFLFLLIFTGIYLFFAPYVARRRSAAV